MGDYDEPDVIYRGYMITLPKFTELMKQVPSYKKLMDSQYGENSHHFCYSRWKRHVLEEKLRKRAPKVKEHSADRDEGEDSHNTHMMFLVGCFLFEDPKQGEDPDHPDAENLLERDCDRKSLERFVKFFGHRGAKDMKIEDFEWGWSIGMNPRYLLVGVDISLT